MAYDLKVSRGMLGFKTPLLDDKCVLLSTASLKGEDELEYVCFSELIETTSEVTEESKVCSADRKASHHQDMVDLR